MLFDSWMHMSKILYNSFQLLERIYHDISENEYNGHYEMNGSLQSEIIEFFDGHNERGV